MIKTYKFFWDGRWSGQMNISTVGAYVYHVGGRNNPLTDLSGQNVRVNQKAKVKHIAVRIGSPAAVFRVFISSSVSGVIWIGDVTRSIDPVTGNYRADVYPDLIVTPEMGNLFVGIVGTTGNITAFTTYTAATGENTAVMGGCMSSAPVRTSGLGTRLTVYPHANYTWGTGPYANRIGALWEIDFGGNFLYSPADDQDKVYGLVGDTFELLADNWNSLINEEKEALFLNTAPVEDYSILQSAGLEKIIIREYAPETEDNFGNISVIAVPPNPMTILPLNTISLAGLETLLAVEVTGVHTISEASKVLFAFTTDTQVYKVYRNDQWITIDLDADFVTEGMTEAECKVLGERELTALLGTDKSLAIAICLMQENVADKVTLERLQFKADLKGCWESASEGIDYSYQYTDSRKLTMKMITANSYIINYMRQAAEV